MKTGTLNFFRWILQKKSSVPVFTAQALQPLLEMAAPDRAAADELPNQQEQAQRRDNVIRLAFGGSEERFREFCALIRSVIPDETTVVLRGSAVTGERWKDGAAFDADGPGSSDLDITLVGDKVIGLFKLTGFFVPGIHSRPLSDDDPDIAPELVPLRDRLMAMVGRPVNIQASREIVLQLRGDIIGQPYLVLIDKDDSACSSES